jgi:polyribonucleotide nucleotidyltransferase
MRPVYLRGSFEAVERAKAEINRTLDERRSQMGPTSHYGPSGMNSPHIKLQIPNDKVGLVIGKAGMTIKAIQDRTGANIQIPGNTDDEDPRVRTCTISGPTQVQSLPAAAAFVAAHLPHQRLAASSGVL